MLEAVPFLLPVFASSLFSYIPWLAISGPGAFKVQRFKVQRFKVQRFEVQRFKVQRFKVQRPPVLPSSLQVGWVLVWGARGSAPRATPG